MKPVQRVHLTGYSEHTNVPKAARHLRTSIHWAKVAHRVTTLPDHTVQLSGYFPELPDLVRHFSEYYPRVTFIITEDHVPTLTFQDGQVIKRG